MDLTQDMAAPAIISTSDSTLPEEDSDGKRLWARRFDFPTGSTPMGREVLRLSASGRRMKPAFVRDITRLVEVRGFVLRTSDDLHECPVAAGDKYRVCVPHDLHDVPGLADALRPHHAHLYTGEVQDGSAVLIKLLPRPSLGRRRVEYHGDVVQGARKRLLQAAEFGRPLTILGHERRL